MSVADYPITLPYGSTVSPYDAAHKHRGRDYGCPTGTPLVVGGQQIGLSGATGHVTGPHCHVQEWKDNYANTREPNNAFKPGIVTNIDPTGTQGDGSFGKFITVQTPDGWNDSYCHLSEIDVKIGDKLGEQTMNIDDVKNLANEMLDKDRLPMSDADAGALAGKSFHDVYFTMAAFQDHINYRNKITTAFAEMDNPTGFKEIPGPVYTKVKE